MAPFAPFLAESTYQNLSSVLTGAKESVHLERFPVARRELLRPELEEAVTVMEALVTLGRNHREKLGVKAKIPLLSMKIIHRDKKVLENLQKFETYFRDELNVKVVHYESDEDRFIQITAKANFPVLGKRVGAKMKAVAAGIQKLSLPDLLKLERGETVTVENETIQNTDVEIRRAPKDQNPNLATHQLVSIEVDPTVKPEQIREGLAREIVRKVQAARKTADFILDDRINLELSCQGALSEAAKEHQAMISRETQASKLSFVAEPSGTHVEEAEIDGEILKIGVTALPRA
jgi:isoleucyl-tRNA synthetase